MWKNPSLLLNSRAQYFRQQLPMLVNIFDNPYPKVSPRTLESALGHQYFERVFEDLRSLVHSNAPDFNNRFGSIFLRLAREIEDGRNYLLFSNLHSAMWDFFSRNIKELGLLTQMITSTLNVLVGSESRQLIGTRNGRPAWKSLRQPITSRLSPDSVLYRYGTEVNQEYLDQSDINMMPEPENWISGIELFYTWPQVDQAEIQRLLEQAYYHQQYIVNPDGAYISLKHFGPVERIILKVKSPGLFDHNYQDFVVQMEVNTSQLSLEAASIFEFTPGETRQTLRVFDGSWMIGQRRFAGESTRGQTYLAWMVALIYHDLVTTEEIVGQRRIRTGSPTPGSQDENDEPTWVYIPRKIRRQRTPPRIPSDNPRFVTPHHVRGHIRRANLSDRHITELDRFERETGLRVLDLLRRNPGHTFVRPHISPSTEGIRDLPRFIHARLQREIDQLMSPPPADENG